MNLLNMDIQLGKKKEHGSNLTGNVMGKGVCGGRGEEGCVWWAGGVKREFNSTGHNYLTSK